MEPGTGHAGRLPVLVAFSLPAGQVRDVVRHAVELLADALFHAVKADLTWRLVAAMAVIGAIPRFVG